MTAEHVMTKSPLRFQNGFRLRSGFTSCQLAWTATQTLCAVRSPLVERSDLISGFGDVIAPFLQYDRIRLTSNGMHSTPFGSLRAFVFRRTHRAALSCQGHGTLQWHYRSSRGRFRWPRCGIGPSCGRSSVTCPVQCSAILFPFEILLLVTGVGHDACKLDSLVTGIMLVQSPSCDALDTRSHRAEGWIWRVISAKKAPVV